MIFHLLFCIFPVLAATPNTWDARLLLEHALKRNPELRLSELEIQAARARTNQAARWDDPNIELGVEKKEEPFGATQFGRISINQSIPRLGRLKNRQESAAGGAKISELNGAQLSLELKGRILGLIYTYQVAVEKAAHAKERVERFKTVETYLRGRPFASPQKRAEASIVRSKLMVLQKELRELQAQQNGAWNSLNLYLGLEKAVRVQIPWYRKAQRFESAELWRRSEIGNLELKRQTLQLEVAASERRIAGLESWPGLTLSAGYAKGQGASPETNYTLGVNLPIPLLNGNRDGQKAAEAMFGAEEGRLSWLREQLQAGLKTALEHYEAAADSMEELNPTRIVGLEREMTDVDQGFKRGQVDLITYLEADSQHFEGLNAILGAQLDYFEALRNILLFTGAAPEPMGM